MAKLPATAHPSVQFDPHLKEHRPSVATLVDPLEAALDVPSPEDDDPIHLLHHLLDTKGPATKLPFATVTRRRLTPDEVELQFTTVSALAPRAVDWTTRALQQRGNHPLLAGVLRMKSPTLLGFSRWRVHWAELYNGVLVLRKFGKNNTLERLPTIVPTSNAHVRFRIQKSGRPNADVDRSVPVSLELELEYQYQHKQQTKRLQCVFGPDVHVWWWMLQLSSVHRLDFREFRELLYYHQSICPDVEFWNVVGTGRAVLYPHRGWASTAATPEPQQVGPHDHHPHPQSNISSTSVLHLILVRHGQADNMKFQVADAEKTLTQRGREQVAATARKLKELLAPAHAAHACVELVHGTVLRSEETADEFIRVMPWLQRTQVECRLLDDGAPIELDDTPTRMEFRSVMESLAFEFLMRSDTTNNVGSNVGNDIDASANVGQESFRIIVGTSSLIQSCIAKCCQVSRDVIRLGAPIAHCSITQINVVLDHGVDRLDAVAVNRVQHLPMTHRTSE